MRQPAHRLSFALLSVIILFPQSGRAGEQGGRATADDSAVGGTARTTVRPPYGPSPVITAVRWDEPAHIIRLAKGGDNWPMTWADDGDLYTGYGDGNGFEPKLDTKLSLGFARVSGDPPDHRGFNIRSRDEQSGQGMKGKKANGMLMIDGRLYMWLFHADNAGGRSQLAWSDDHARNWHFADWKFSEFGLMSFVNFGRNYGGARDNFVYMVSHDGPLAHEPADRMVLVRVPKDRLADRSAYEFLARRDSAGIAVWTSSIERRGANFEHPGQCLRSSMTYNAGLKQYLYWQQLPNTAIGDHGDTRFEGGFGIYAAPEPWGPWTTAYFTPTWDVGPGERAEFPTKWMSDDGRTCWLVFSGDDSFAVRKATFETVEN